MCSGRVTQCPVTIVEQSREIKLLSEHHSATNAYKHKYNYNWTNEVEYWSKSKQQAKYITSPNIPKNTSSKKNYSLLKENTDKNCTKMTVCI